MRGRPVARGPFRVQWSLSGFEPGDVTPPESKDLRQTSNHRAAVGGDSPPIAPELASVIEAWSRLSPAIHEANLAMGSSSLDESRRKCRSPGFPIPNRPVQRRFFLTEFPPAIDCVIRMLHQTRNGRADGSKTINQTAKETP